MREDTVRTWLAGTCLPLLLATGSACTTNPYTGEPTLSKAAIGGLLGAGTGAAIAAATGDNGKQRKKRALIGAGVGFYSSNQSNIEKLRADPANTGLRDAVDRSLFAHIAMVEAALPGMRERRWGRILAITTVGVREPLPGMVYSNVARTGLTAYLKQLSREVIRDGVTVNSLLPNSHRTARLERMIPDLQGYEASLVSGRIGRADDFGQVAAFLCSAQANYITGVALPVDGGSGTALA